MPKETKSAPARSRATGILAVLAIAANGFVAYRVSRSVLRDTQSKRLLRFGEDLRKLNGEIALALSRPEDPANGDLLDALLDARRDLLVRWLGDGTVIRMTELAMLVRGFHDAYGESYPPRHVGIFNQLNALANDLASFLEPFMAEERHGSEIARALPLLAFHHSSREERFLWLGHVASLSFKGGLRPGLDEVFHSVLSLRSRH